MNATKYSMARMYILCVLGRWCCAAGLQMCMYVYKQTYTYTLPTTTILDNVVIHAYNSSRSNPPIMVEYFHQCFTVSFFVTGIELLSTYSCTKWRHFHLLI